MLKRDATTYGGRNGVIKDMESGLELSLSKPVEMGGKKEFGSNPEELFSAGYSSCFAGSLEYLLNVEQVAYEGIEVKVTTNLLADPKTGFSFQIVIAAKVLGVTKEVEKSFIEKAYAFCPYSKAIRGNVDVLFV
jgi:Ohr subfamily peroxiredoxin